MLKAQTDPSVQQELATAARVQKTGKANFHRQDVQSAISRSYSLECYYDFYEESQFAEVFGLAPSLAGLKIDELIDERGTKVRGVAVRSCNVPRRLVIRSNLEQNLSERLFKSEDQLRSWQGHEMYAHYATERARNGPSFLKETPLSESAMKELVATKKLEMETRRALPPLEEVQPAPEPEAPPAPEPPLALLASDSEDDKEAVGMLGASTVGNDNARPKRKASKAKAAAGKGRGKAKSSQGRKSQKTQSEAGSQRPASEAAGLQSQGGSPQRAPTARSRSPPRLPASLRGGQRDHDTSSSASLGKCTSSPPEVRAKGWMESLDLSSILKGAPKGNELYQARRVRDQLCKSDPTCMEYVMIKGHIEKCVKAQKMVASKVSSLHPAERKEIVTMLLEERVSWPADVQIALLSSSLKELVNAPVNQKDSAASGQQQQQIVDMVMPQEFAEDHSSATQPEWDPMKPRLGMVAVSDETALAKIWCRLVVTETLVPLIMQGTQKQAFLKAVAIKSREQLQKVDVKTLRPVMKAAHETCVSALSAVLVLLCPDIPLSELKHLDRVATARDGVLSHLRQSLLQAPVYRHMQQDLRTREVAQTQFSPMVEEACGKVKAAAESKDSTGPQLVEVLRESCANISHWRAAMRQGSVDHLDRLCMKLIAAVQADEKTTSETLQSLADAIPMLIAETDNMEEPLLLFKCCTWRQT